MTLPDNFALDLDEEAKEVMNMPWHFHSRLPLCFLSIPSSSISPDGTEWLHCVEAEKQKNFIRIRVITKSQRGVTVTVYSETTALYYKYLDLRFQVRNSDRVMITFPAIYVQASPCVAKELYLTANDFRLPTPQREEWHETQPQPVIIV